MLNVILIPAPPPMYLAPPLLILDHTSSVYTPTTAIASMELSGTVHQLVKITYLNVPVRYMLCLQF